MIKAPAKRNSFYSGLFPCNLSGPQTAEVMYLLKTLMPFPRLLVFSQNKDLLSRYSSWFLFLCMSLLAFMSMYHMHAVFKESRRGYWVFWNRSYKWL